jgi:formate dehydrogenase beta subunit
MDLFDPDESFDYPGLTQRQEPDVLDPDVRINNFDEVEKGFNEAQAIKEASRCLRCYRIAMAAV